MRFVLPAAAAVLVLSMVSCAPPDPDLDPQPNLPTSASDPKPWNRPISGQGGGMLGSLPNQQLRR
jgi:hypothetical protein